MARLPVFLLAASALAFAGCGPKAAVAPAEPAIADEWYMFSARPDGPSQIGVNIHETKNGLAGRLWRSGKLYPIRNVTISGENMSFIVPALDMSWSATKDVARKWRGAWTTKDGETPSVMGPSNPPDLEGKAFVALTDGRQMFLDCRGEGAPAVVLDAGAGGTTLSWSLVHDEIAKTTRTCAYDRAGHGLSDPGPLPLDTAAVANDMDAILTAAGIAGPYVLVGHSLGSYHVRQFANTRFDKVAGMVLVDPSGDGQAARFNQVMPKARAIMAKAGEAAKAANCSSRLREKLVLRDDPLFLTCNGTNDGDMFEQTQSEIDSMPGASTDQLTESRRSYGDLPLIVLTRGDYSAGMPREMSSSDRSGFKKVWIAMHEEMTALSTAGELRTVAKAGHNIQRDQPQAVIDAVNEVVAKARERAPAP